jgi:hypothetical protein
MVVARVVVLVTLVGGAVTAASACSGGGGSPGSGGSGNECQDFFNLTNDCYSRAGKQLNANPAACSNAGALDEQTLAEIQCALASPDAYCKSIGAVASLDAASLSATDPEIVKLNACTASHNTASPCKEAILALANCGVGFGFAPDCPAESAPMAKCIVDNPTGACAAYGQRPAGTALPPEAQAFQQCQLDASRAALDASR